MSGLHQYPHKQLRIRRDTCLQENESVWKTIEIEEMIEPEVVEDSGWEVCVVRAGIVASKQGNCHHASRSSFLRKEPYNTI